MNFCGIHFCTDELRMLIIAIPIVGPIGLAIWTWIKHQFLGKCHYCEQKKCVCDMGQ